ncbi:retrovirus-related pol polyprotein from transposon TNT 1-94 [Tanacetum coccineum]|uniref:Retrovirus-related pol polyprotein from transposon TNT 1-94 n=1 Tax=Tanacetum coccineum TaxID=301880 RepID=A0ABQ5CZP0_9ASTR
MSNSNTNLQTQSSNALHNAIMEAGSKDRPPMLAPGNYVQWKSRIKRYIDTKPNSELIHYCLQNPPYTYQWAEKTVPVAEGSSETTTERYMENYKNVSQDIRDQLNAEAEAVQIILTGIDNDIYSTVDACPNACEMWKAIERLKQGESINVQDLETNLYWEFGKFTSRDGESLESYYSRFYKMMNELVRNQCHVTNHQVNVQFLLQLQPEWQRNLQTYHTTFELHQTPVRANQDKSPRINRGSGKDNQRAVNVAGARENVELEAHNMIQAQLQEQKPEINFLESSKQRELVDKLKGEIEDFKTKNKSLESSNNHFKEANNELSKTNQLMFKDLKKFQAELDKYNDVNYASKGCYNDNLALMLAPDSDETIRLEKERRSKLSDLIRPFDYDQLNNLYDLFVPQREKSPEQHYFPKTSKMSHTSSNKEFSKESFRKQTTLLEKRMDESIPWDQNTFISMALIIVQTAMDVPINTREPKQNVNQSVATSSKKTIATDSTVKKFRNTTRKIYEQVLQTSSQAWLWHHRLSHLNFDTINLLSKNNIVNGLPKLKFVKDHLCSSCELGKAKRKSFHTKTTPSSKRRLQLLHMDLCGPMRVESINGKKYVLVIVDDYSRYTWTHFLRSKDETPRVLIDFLTLVQRGLHAQVTTVRTDKGTKFLNKTLHAYFAKEGIRHETSTARTPEQNGVVKRRNRTLVEAARTMLSAAKVPLFFWAEAIATTCFTQNRSLVIPRHEKTPYHIINARKPSVKFFHIFGSLCYTSQRW